MKNILYIAFLFSTVSFGQEDTVHTYEYIELECDYEEPCYVELEPEFPGGDKALFKYIQQEIEYRNFVTELEVGGIIYVRFTVDKGGMLRDVKILMGLQDAADTEVIRLIEAMPCWTPGMLCGKPARVTYTLPIRIELR